MQRTLRAAVVLTLLASSASAQQFWEKKKYENWSKDECRRVLEQSPWAQKYSISVPIFAAAARSGSTTGRSGQDVTGTAGASTLDVTYITQLRSALPMRKAVVQQALLQAMSQHPSIEQMQAMHNKADAFISAPIADIVLVHFIYGSNDQNIDRGLARYWQQQTLETVKDSFTLIGSNGHRVAPLRFEALSGAGREFAVTFPRTIDGEPIIGPADQALVVEFYLPDVQSPSGSMSTSALNSGVAPLGSTVNKSRAVVQFKVKDMTHDGQLIF
jgi:hypothetical protein